MDYGDGFFAGLLVGFLVTMVGIIIISSCVDQEEDKLKTRRLRAMTELVEAHLESHKKQNFDFNKPCVSCAYIENYSQHEALERRG